ncbi:MAG: hypothetical protein H7245_20060 [Candidatus Saccharibacteria bacterium]|nr:hypothetical protein [Pseudorhodobacter sp.]
MIDKEKLAQLRHVSQLLLDVRLMTLDRATQARQDSLDRLAELNRPAPPSDLNPVIAGEVAMRYQLWADQRRSAINLVLARQTVEWTEARKDASEAFGRNQVVGKLQDGTT